MRLIKKRMKIILEQNKLIDMSTYNIKMTSHIKKCYFDFPKIVLMIKQEVKYRFNASLR